VSRGICKFPTRLGREGSSKNLVLAAFLGLRSLICNIDLSISTEYGTAFFHEHGRGTTE
jgi:hypothetical protein